MIGTIVFGIVVFLLACALVRVMPDRIIPAAWKAVLYVVALILMMLWIGWQQGWI